MHQVCPEQQSGLKQDMLRWHPLTYRGRKSSRNQDKVRSQVQAVRQGVVERAGPVVLRVPTLEPSTYASIA